MGRNGLQPPVLLIRNVEKSRPFYSAGRTGKSFLPIDGRGGARSDIELPVALIDREECHGIQGAFIDATLSRHDDDPRFNEFILGFMQLVAGIPAPLSH